MTWPLRKMPMCDHMHDHIGTARYICSRHMSVWHSFISAVCQLCYVMLLLHRWTLVNSSWLSWFVLSSWWDNTGGLILYWITILMQSIPCPLETKRHCDTSRRILRELLTICWGFVFWSVKTCKVSWLCFLLFCVRHPVVHSDRTVTKRL